MYLGDNINKPLKKGQTCIVVIRARWKLFDYSRVDVTEQVSRHAENNFLRVDLSHYKYRNNTYTSITL